MEELIEIAGGKDQAGSISARKILDLGIEKIDRSEIFRDHKDYRFIVTYPSLPLMKDGSGEGLFRDNSEEVSLYVHIPFCLSRCTFCSRFEKHHGTTQNSIDDYIDGLMREWKNIENQIGQDRSINSVYIGGGTPTILDDLQTQKILDTFIHGLDLADNSEITYEMSPETATHDKISNLIDAGVNRLSMGVQDLNDEVLKRVDRLHDSAKVNEVVDMVKDMGFNNLNLDLIHGLPTQTIASREKSIDSIMELEPDSITDYPLYIHSDSQLSCEPAGSFPKYGETLIMAHQAMTSFKDNGFTQEPIHWFSKGDGHIQQKRKFRNGQLIGLGLASYGYYNGVQYHNTSDIKEYLRLVNKDISPITKSISLTDEMNFIFRLSCL